MADFAIQFDGVDSYVQVADNNLDGLNTGTIEFFIKLSAVSAFQKIVFKDGCIDIGVTNNGNVFAEIGGAANLGQFGGEIDDDIWHHVAITWDGSFIRGYVDGVYFAKVAHSTAQANNTNPLYLGRRITTEPFSGILEEFRYSNIARYTTETSFTKPGEPFENDANTLILFHFNEGSGTSISDSSTNTNEGSLENGGTFVEGKFPFDSRSTRIIGKVTISEARNAKLKSKDTTSSNRSVRTIGNTTISEARNAKTKGNITLSNTRGARIIGLGKSWHTENFQDWYDKY